MIVNGWTQVCIFVLGGCLALPVAAALVQLPAPTLPASHDAATSAATARAPVCFTDVFSGPLPGRSDYCLGMRDWNKGHYQSGLEFLKLAAGWGNKNAQYTLGLIYYGGRHVPADTALGLAWLRLADERRNDNQIDLARRSAFKWAAPAQREQAQQLYQTMTGRYGDKVAANRAWQRLYHWKRRNAMASGCVRVFGAQAAAARRLGLAGVPPQSIESMLVSSEPISVPNVEGLRGMMKSAQAMKRVHNFANARAGVCITLHTQQQATQQLAGEYFAGWRGVVTVEPLQVVPAPAASSGH